MTIPGPPQLGRSVLVRAGAVAPAAWAGAPRVVIDATALASPVAVVTRLHTAWADREAVIIELAVDPGEFRAPRDHPGDAWRLGVAFEPSWDRLHHLVWANSYDARDGEPVWWWGRKAVRLGASEGGPADVVLADGTAAWVDGGPRQPWSPALGAVVNSETIDAGRLDVQPEPRPPTATLADDQLAAVAHLAGPARIIAPAGSGKTRVLTERLRHLVADRRYGTDGLVAVAYNRMAQEEMAARTAGLGTRIQTLNAWAYSLVAQHLGRRPPVLTERDVRSIVERLVPAQRRRANTDPMGAYLEGLSLIRLGLRNPAEVEESLDDVPGLAQAFDPYRAELRRQGAVDFDEQVYGAVEALLHDGAFRRDVQARHRHLLVDELQDLTPAHVLLVRLVSCPAYDVFGVGDDDQTIYGHAGADPRFLVAYDRWFPGGGSHALRVNYRCPAAVTVAAATLLTHNQVRVAKEIVPGPDVEASPGALDVRLHPTDQGAVALVQVVQGWLAEGTDPGGVAVLSRVQSLLLAPHVALTQAGVALSSIVDARLLDRLGLRAALAYLRIAVAPDSLAGADVSEVQRRPSRGLPTWVDKWLGRCRSIDDVRRAGLRIDDAKVARKLDDLAADLDLLAGLAAGGATTRRLLLAIRDDVGLGDAMGLLDADGGAAGSHLDDLEGLLQVADLHPEPATFEPWLRGTLGKGGARDAEVDGTGAVRLSTIHRVKGREWQRVAVVGVSDGVMPHRLADDDEEERRVLHVGMTRGIERVVLLGDATRPSPFIAELLGQVAVGARRGARATGAAAAPAPRRSVRSAPTEARGPADPAVLAALQAWRATRAQQLAVPAYVVFSNDHLEGIAAKLPRSMTELRSCPGVGPKKLDAYGDDVLAIIAEHAPID